MKTDWSTIIAAAALLGAGVAAWANLKSSLASLRAWMEARHEENLRRFERLEGTHHE